MNVVLVVFDTLRKDHLGTYGNDWIRTLNFHAFAAQDARCTRAVHVLRLTPSLAALSNRAPRPSLWVFSDPLDTWAVRVDTFGEKLDTLGVKVNTSGRKLDTLEGKVNTFGEKLNTFANPVNTSPAICAKPIAGSRIVDWPGRQRRSLPDPPSHNHPANPRAHRRPLHNSPDPRMFGRS